MDSSLRVESSLPIGRLGCIIGRGMEHSYAKTNSPHTFEVDGIQVSFDVIIASFQYDPKFITIEGEGGSAHPSFTDDFRCCFHLHLCSSILQKNVTPKVKEIPWPKNPLLIICSFNLTPRLPRPLSYILRHTFSYLDQTNLFYLQVTRPTNANPSPCPPVPSPMPIPAANPQTHTQQRTKMNLLSQRRSRIFPSSSHLPSLA